jgi:hypothetical protein
MVNSLQGPSRGLTGLGRKDLKNILRALHRGDLDCPMTPMTMAQAGLSYLQDRVDFLHGLDNEAVRAAVTAVLYERGPEKD